MSENGTEHIIHVESTQVWRGSVSPEEAEFLTGDGERTDILGRTGTEQSFDLQLHEETKLTFECECGQRFRKPETAREHLEDEVSAGTESGVGDS